MALFDFLRRRPAQRKTSYKHYTIAEDNALAVNEPLIEHDTRAINDDSPADRRHEVVGDFLPEPVAKATIEVTYAEALGHGDHFGALMGFEDIRTRAGWQLAVEMAALSVIKPPTLQNPVAQISEADFIEIGGTPGAPKIRSVRSLGTTITSFPYVPANYVLAFETKKIAEWKTTDELQADIEGIGPGTLNIGFFATDYAVNKDIYKHQASVNIKISALALALQEIREPAAADNEQAPNPDFRDYITNTVFYGQSCYDFAGRVLTCKRVFLSNNISGYLLSVKLIRNAVPDFFIADVFINEQNTKITDVRAGMTIAGSFWFQGELS